MTIQELVDELKGSKYTSDEKKIEYLKKHLKTTYLPYLQKISACSSVLNTIRYTEVQGRKMYTPSGANEYVMKIYSILRMYYDFNIEAEENYEILDKLEENDLTELVLKAVGKDLMRYDAVYNIISEDMSYNASLVPYLENKMDAISMTLNAMVPVLEAAKKRVEQDNKQSN